MPNKIFIEYTIISRTLTKQKKGIVKGPAQLTNKRTLEIPMTSDVTIEAVSEWSRLSDLIPGFLKKTLNIMTTFSSLGGKINKGLLNFTNKLELPFWQSSPPVKINVQLGFFTKTDAYTDVFEPVKEIVGLSILSKDPNNQNQFITPGINLRNFNEIGAKEAKIVTRTSKIAKFEIPGIIYLPYAIIESARPTFSMEVTESSYPLWATLDLNIIGAGPASTEMFEDAETSPLLWGKQIDYSIGKTLGIFK